ncbi:hypothetical protein [Paracoccus aminovorans]|uniref:hypothetical protein n=1 Tax=Paracoccus aminovorans TaxID=34004 RepID=UPI002B263D25|nr:hypothetical protein [Paracoccus aminovorans]
MNKRRRDRLEERREASRAASATPAPVSRARPLADKVSRPINRSPFMAAKARRDLVEALPDVVYQRPAARKPAEKRSAPAADVPRKPDAPRKPAPRPVLDTRKPEAKPLTLDRLETCKSRPDSRKTGGKGAGRAFVPWCR